MASGSGGSGIRLRPLGIGDLLDETFRIYRRHFLAFLVVMGVVLVPTIVVKQAIQSAAVPTAPLSLPGAPPELPSGPIGPPGAQPGPPGAPIVPPGPPGVDLPSPLVLMLSSLSGWLVSFVTNALVGGAATLLASNAILGHTLSIAEAYRQAFRRLGPLLWATALATLKIVLFAITIVGLYHAVRRYLGWGLIDQAIMLEGQDANGSMRRSWVLVDRHRRRMLVCWLLIALLQLVLVNGSDWVLRYGIRLLRDGSSASLLAMPSADAVAVAVSALTATLFGSIWYIATTLFYYDLRVRKEGLDLEHSVARLASPPSSPQSPA